MARRRAHSRTVVSLHSQHRTAWPVLTYLLCTSSECCQALLAQAKRRVAAAGAAAASLNVDSCVEELEEAFALMSVSLS